MEPTKKDPSYWDIQKAKVLKHMEEAKKLGRPKAFESPQQLLDLAYKYFQQQDGAPWLKKDFKGRDAEEVFTPTAAPYLWSGFDAFLYQEIGIASIKDYRTAARNPDYRGGMYKDFVEVVRHIDEIMTKQKLEGTITGAYNSNIVARLLGLVDKVEDVSKKPDIKPKFVFVNKSKN